MSTTIQKSKTLLITILLISGFSFAQQKEKTIASEQSDKDEEKFFVPWKNVVKTDLFGLGLTLANTKVYYYGLEYERVLNKRLSLCLQTGYIRPYYEETVLKYGSTTFLDYDLYYEGWYFSPKIRVYVMNNKPKHPRGTFVNFGVSYYSLNRKIKFNNSIQNNPKTDQNVKLAVGSFILGVGHQGMIGSRVTLSAGVNLSLVLGEMSNEKDGFVSAPEGIYPSGEISLGYAFGVN